MGWPLLKLGKHFSWTVNNVRMFLLCPRFKEKWKSLISHMRAIHPNVASISYQLPFSICRTRQDQNIGSSNKWEQRQETKTSEKRWSTTKIVVEGKTVQRLRDIRQIPDILCVLYYMWSCVKSCNNVPTATRCSIGTTDKWELYATQRFWTKGSCTLGSCVTYHKKKKRFLRLGAYVVEQDVEKNIWA